MKPEQRLQEIFGIPFERVENIVRLREFYHPAAYCVSDTGVLLGLCAVDQDIKQVVLPSDWTALRYINLSGNQQLQSLEFAGSLPALVHLDLSGSGLESLKLPAGFDNLRWLDLSRNKLGHFIPLGRFVQLRYLDVSNNQLQDFSAYHLRQFPRLEHLYLQNNNLPSAKRAALDEKGNGLPFLQRFLRELGKGVTENKEYKVLLVGNGGVGKSCLVERLVYGSFDQRHLSTQGIVLDQYDKEDYPFILNLWDFGGQDIYHATHRIFMLSNAVYLALWDEYTRINPHSTLRENDVEQEYPNYPLDYWLHYIRQLGNDSPILVVKTKKQKDGSLHPRQGELHQKYGVLDFVRIDSELDDPIANGYHRLLGSIQEAIAAIGLEKELPQNWADLRQHLRTLQVAGNKVLSLEEFQDIADDYAIEDGLSVLENWLVPSGVVYYRQGYFGDHIVLQMGWAIKAIYGVFRRDNGCYHRLRDTQKGRFTGADLQKIWQNANYSAAEQELLVNFMISCELCFEELSDNEQHSRDIPFPERQFVAPQLIPDEVPTSAAMLMEQPDMLHVRYRHDFLHYGIIQSFIVRAQALADTRDIWQSGIVLKEAGGYALVAAERMPKRGAHAFDIRVICSRADAELLDKIRNTLEELQGESVTEWVSVNGKDFVAFDKLESWDQDQIPTAPSGKLARTADFHLFLEHRKQDKFSLPQEQSKERTDQLVQQLEKEGLVEGKESPIEPPVIEFAGEKPVILFLQANPTHDLIDWEKEYVFIRKNLSGSFLLESCENASVDDIIDAVEHHAPSVIHFCGHGVKAETDESGVVHTPSGLVLHNESKNDSEVLTTEQITQLFQGFEDDAYSQLKIVLLNACYSREQAASISQANLLTIGTTDQVTSLAARKFAAGFYKNLARGVDLLTTIKRGINRAGMADSDSKRLIEAYFRGQRIYPQ